MFVVNMTNMNMNMNMISWSEKNVYFIRAFGTHEIYIFSLHSMK